jgi:predicted N-acyltransferase
MDGGDAGVMSIETCDRLDQVGRAAWDAIANPEGAPFDPFLTWDFLQALEETGCVGGRTGWTPRHLLAKRGGALVAAMPLYLKAHSYGEYVFDHSWADALHRAGGRYYPKLLSAAPFTPVTGRRLLGEAGAHRPLIDAALALAKAERASSLHVTFPTADQAKALGAIGLLQRTGVQFHWTNHSYGCFADFLGALSANKRKTIRRERERAIEDVSIETLRGAEITPAILDAVFACYMDTGSRKWGSPYLNRAFFDALGARMGDRLVVFLARMDGRPAAMALNLLGSDCIYGRYWGRLVDVPFLHFELCYYQAIDFAIQHGLARVEAGAQGEHKLLRGYAPAATYSAHWIAHPGLRAAVADFLAHETPAIADEIEELDAHTPFRKSVEN